jgi:peptidoglycan/LPS O-acetylase OafA/YrhL
MSLALNFLLTILIELPIIALFFKRKKRQAAVLMALLINIISWSVAHIIFFSTDFNMTYAAIVLAIGEAIAFHKFLECKWKKAIIMSLIVNSLSFCATKYIPTDIFQSRPGGIKTAYDSEYQSR